MSKQYIPQPMSKSNALHERTNGTHLKHVHICIYIYIYIYACSQGPAGNSARAVRSGPGQVAMCIYIYISTYGGTVLETILDEPPCSVDDLGAGLDFQGLAAGKLVGFRFHVLRFRPDGLPPNLGLGLLVDDPVAQHALDLHEVRLRGIRVEDHLLPFV